MSKRIVLIVALALVTGLLFAACERSAAGPMPVLATPTVAGSGQSAQPTGISLVEAWGTSTAIYQQTAAAAGLLPATATPTVGALITDTPTITPFGFVPTSTSIIPPTGSAATATTDLFSTTPIVVVPTATPGRPATYTLQNGEFPYCIARRFNVDPNDLTALNGLSQAESTGLQPGFVLKIPQTGSFPGTRALHPHPTSYTVMVDDTITGIACYFGDVDPSSIAAANGLSSLTAPLATGRVLNIP